MISYLFNWRIFLFLLLQQFHHFLLQFFLYLHLCLFILCIFYLLIRIYHQILKVFKLNGLNFSKLSHILWLDQSHHRCWNLLILKIKYNLLYLFSSRWFMNNFLIKLIWKKKIWKLIFLNSNLNLPPFIFKILKLT